MKPKKPFRVAGFRVRWVSLCTFASINHWMQAIIGNGAWPWMRWLSLAKAKSWRSSTRNTSSSWENKPFHPEVDLRSTAESQLHMLCLIKSGAIGNGTTYMCLFVPNNAKSLVAVILSKIKCHYSYHILSHRWKIKNLKGRLGRKH